MWEELRAAFADIEADPSVRVVVLTGEGKNFCSGGDLRYQSSQRGTSRDERLAEASKLAHLLRDMDVLSKPLIARVNGSAFAGGTSFIAVADVAIGTTAGTFAITEPRLGLVPAMIAPYVARRVGISNARRLILTARPFSGIEAVQYGLLHAAVPPEQLDSAIEEELALVLAYVSTNQQPDNFAYTVEGAADMWDSPEAKEGVASFLEKRKPSWAKR